MMMNVFRMFGAAALLGVTTAIQMDAAEITEDYVQNFAKDFHDTLLFHLSIVPTVYKDDFKDWKDYFEFLHPSAKKMISMKKTLGADKFKEKFLSTDSVFFETVYSDDVWRKMMDKMDQGAEPIALINDPTGKLEKEENRSRVVRLLTLHYLIEMNFLTDSGLTYLDTKHWLSMTDKYVNSNFREFLYDGQHSFTNELTFEKQSLDDEGPRKIAEDRIKTMTKYLEAQSTRSCIMVMPMKIAADKLRFEDQKLMKDVSSKVKKFQRDGVTILTKEICEQETLDNWAKGLDAWELIDIKLESSKSRPVVREFFNVLEIAQERLNDREEIEWNEKAKRFKSKKTGKFVSAIYYDEDVKRYRNRKTGRFASKPEIEKSKSEDEFVMVDNEDEKVDDIDGDDEMDIKKDDDEDDTKSPFKEGCKVKMQAIKSSPVLNGLEGVLGKKMENGRWVVIIDKTQSMSVDARKRCEQFKPKYQASFGDDKLEFVEAPEKAKAFGPEAPPGVEKFIDAPEPRKAPVQASQPMLPTKRDKSRQERAAVFAASLVLSTIGVMAFTLSAHEEDKDIEYGKTLATVVLLAFFVYSKIDKQEKDSRIDNFIRDLKL